MNPARRCALALSLAATCLSAACSRSPASADAALIPAANAAPAGNFRPCDRISAADVQPFFTAPVKKRAPESNDDGSSWNCYFDVTVDNGPTLQILTAIGPAASFFKGRSLTDDGKPGVALTGVGDTAFREHDDIWVYAWKGAMFCMIHSDHSYAQAGDVEMMRGLRLSDSRAKKIPAATAQVLAEALGTLCNRVFGSGNTTPSFAGVP